MVKFYKHSAALTQTNFIQFKKFSIVSYNCNVKRTESYVMSILKIVERIPFIVFFC